MTPTPKRLGRSGRPAASEKKTESSVLARSKRWGLWASMMAVPTPCAAVLAKSTTPPAARYTVRYAPARKSPAPPDGLTAQFTFPSVLSMVFSLTHPRASALSQAQRAAASGPGLFASSQARGRSCFPTKSKSRRGLSTLLGLIRKPASELPGDCPHGFAESLLGGVSPQDVV